jgi:predicted membrane-bound mannosyltransferase
VQQESSSYLAVPLECVPQHLHLFAPAAVATGQGIAAAVASGEINGAAQQIADAVNSGNADAVAAATALTATAGTTPQFTQAASLAVTQFGADASAVADALSQVMGACTAG